MIPLLIVAGALLLAVLLIRVFFRGTKRGNQETPSTAGRERGADTSAAEREQKALLWMQGLLADMSAQQREAVQRLEIQYGSQLSSDTFAALCLLAAEYTGRLIDDLPSLTLRDEMDSTDIVNFVLALEDLLRISISDNQAGKIVIFKDLVRFVESTAPNSRITAA